MPRSNERLCLWNLPPYIITHMISDPQRLMNTKPVHKNYMSDPPEGYAAIASETQPDGGAQHPTYTCTDGACTNKAITEIMTFSRVMACELALPPGLLVPQLVVHQWCLGW